MKTSEFWLMTFAIFLASTLTAIAYCYATLKSAQNAGFYDGVCSAECSEYEKFVPSQIGFYKLTQDSCICYSGDNTAIVKPLFGKKLAVKAYE